MTAPAGHARGMVLLVPRHEVSVYQYLVRSLAQVSEVEVVLDRRVTPRGDAAEPAPERRSRGRAPQRRILMCALIERPEVVAERPPLPTADPPPAPTTAAPALAHRTLLWPGLRVERL